LERKPLLIVVFGSTAKGTYKNDSDIDILEVNYEKNKEEKIKKYVEAQTGIRLQIFKMNGVIFNKELNSNNVQIGYNIDSIGIDNYDIGYLEYHEGVKKYFNEISLITNTDNENCKYLIGNIPCNNQTLRDNNFLIVN
jgi:DNA polymerase sigma